MDYSYYAEDSLPIDLFHSVNSFSKVFINKMRQMEQQGFDLAKFVVFGFSTGAQIAIHGGSAMGGRFGKVYGIFKSRVLNRNAYIILIDVVMRLSRLVCDHPHIAFAGVENIDPQMAGRRVQGIHTSNNVGTTEYDNHVDFVLGHCGKYQVANANHSMLFGSHRMCPIMFNCAFSNTFQSTPRPAECVPNPIDHALAPDESCVMGWHNDNDDKYIMDRQNN